jgi:hypothetical protein
MDTIKLNCIFRVLGVSYPVELLTLCRVDPYVNVIMDDNPYLELACIITNSLK